MVVRVRVRFRIKGEKKISSCNTKNTTQYEIRIAYFLRSLTVFIKPRHHAVQTIHAVMRLATVAYLVPFSGVSNDESTTVLRNRSNDV